MLVTSIDRPRLVRPSAAALAATCLAVLTLTVFFLLREYGPESVLRKWHHAAINGNLAGLERATISTGTLQSTRVLASRLHEFARLGAQYELLGVDRRRDRTVCQVQYTFPNRNVRVPMLWVVDREENRWKVNPDETILVIRRAMGLGATSDPSY